MEPTIWVAALGLLSTTGSWWIGRRQRKAETDSVIAGAAATATAAVQDTYQQLIADLAAQVTAATQEATSARTAARESRHMAQEAENSAWLADMRARAMERFLIELRPLIAAHVPGAEPILARLDALTSVRP